MTDAMTKPALCQAYGPFFRIGAAVSNRMTAVPALRDLICRHFSSLTADNQMKPMFLLDRDATLAQGDPARVALRFAPADALLSFARDAGIAVRFQTALRAVADIDGAGRAVVADGQGLVDAQRGGQRYVFHQFHGITGLRHRYHRREETFVHLRAGRIVQIGFRLLRRRDAQNTGI